MYSKALGEHEGGFHFVVVTGYDNDNFYVNNPWPKSKKQAIYPKAEFMYGIHASSVGDVDNSSLLIASRKQD